MRLHQSLICTLLQTLQIQALIEPTKRNGTVAEKSFIDPDLSKDVASDEVNFLDPQLYSIPPDFFHKLNEFESRLGLDPNSTHVDLRSGRVDLLTPATPVLPGDGVENHLLWSVSSQGDTHHVSPARPEEWEELAVRAVNNWMLEYASDLDINVESELFLQGTVRTTVHDDGDMIQLHIPRMFKGIPVEGSRAMATIKLGNLINVGFEDWGSIPDDFDVLPSLSVEDAYDVVSAHVGQRRIRGEEHCVAELQILTMTPSSLNGVFGQGYQYKLAWRVCPTFEQQDVEAMEGLVDAQTGKIYSFVDRVHYFESKGGVYPISNDGRNQDGKEQPGWPMPFQTIGSETTDSGGNYFVSSGSATFVGPYVRVGELVVCHLSLSTSSFLSYCIIDSRHHAICHMFKVDNCGSSSLSGLNGLDWGTSGGSDCK